MCPLSMLHSFHLSVKIQGVHPPGKLGEVGELDNGSGRSQVKCALACDMLTVCNEQTERKCLFES